MNSKGYYADLKENIAFPLTLQMSDLINPTTIKTSYSKTITIPRTDTNDKIFSEYFKLDKMVDLASFNALEKTPFTLYFNGSEQLFAGWVKLNKITSTDYELNLMSFENMLFTELAGKKLSEIGLDLTHKVGRDFIWNGWNTDDGLYGTLKYCPSYKGLYNNFNSKKRINPISATLTIDLPEDIDEYNKFEMRSYYQHPAIKMQEIIKSICADNNIVLASDDDFFSSNNPYWEKLFMVSPKYFSTDKATSVFFPTYRGDQAGTGQAITNSSGTLTTNTVGRVHSTTISDDYELESSYRLDLSKYPSGVVQVDWEFDIEIEAALSQEMIDLPEGYGVNIDRYYGISYKSATPYDISEVNGFCRVDSYVSGQHNINTHTDYIFRPITPVIEQMGIEYGYPTSFTIIKKPDNYVADNYIKIRFGNFGSLSYENFVDNQTVTNYNALPTTTRIKGSAIINNDGTDKYISFHPLGYNAATNTPTSPAFRLSVTNAFVDPQEYLEKSFYKSLKFRFKVIEDDNLRITVKPYSGQLRSNYKVTAENILDSTITQAEFLVDYMKLFGLVCVYDKLNKQYTLSSRNKFFSNAQMIDWTYKVNPKDLEIEPTPIDARKYKFKWADISATHYDRYKKVFDSEYGSVLINSNNQHLDNTEVLYDSKFACPLIEQSYNFDTYNQQYRLPFQALSMCTYNGATREAAIPSNLTLVFFDGLETYPLNTLDGKKNFMILSDDIDNMKINNEFYWSTYPQTGEMKYASIICTKNGVPVFPKFTSLIENVASLDFAVPKLTYFDVEVNSLNDNICIYNRFYEKFLLDKFSVHNRVITVPVQLTNTDVANFQFNNFYFINNTPYVVIKISDYNPANDNPTKVTLLRVMDFNNYINGQTILINSTRRAEVNLGLIDLSYPIDTLCEVNSTYSVEDDLLVTEKGFYVGNVKVVDGVSAPGIISTEVTREYRSSSNIIKSYIIYNGKEYVNDTYTINFPIYSATFENYTVSSGATTYTIELEFTTNMVVKEKGFYLNGVKYVSDAEEGIIRAVVTQTQYTVIGYLIGEDDTYLQSNAYIIK